MPADVAGASAGDYPRRREKPGVTSMWGPPPHPAGKPALRRPPLRLCGL